MYNLWEFGQKIFFENAFKQKYQGMIVSRGSYNKCQQRLYHFMDSTYRHPILRTETEPTLLDDCKLNFRLIFDENEHYKRKRDDIEFHLYEKYDTEFVNREVVKKQKL